MTTFKIQLEIYHYVSEEFHVAFRLLFVCLNSLMPVLCVTFPTNIKLFMHYYCIIAKTLQRPMLMILCEFFLLFYLYILFCFKVCCCVMLTLCDINFRAIWITPMFITE